MKLKMTIAMLLIVVNLSQTWPVRAATPDCRLPGYVDAIIFWPDIRGFGIPLSKPSPDIQARIGTLTGESYFIQDEDYGKFVPAHAELQWASRIALLRGGDLTYKWDFLTHPDYPGVIFADFYTRLEAFALMNGRHYGMHPQCAIRVSEDDVRALFDALNAEFNSKYPHAS